MSYGLLVNSTNNSNQIDSDSYDEGLSVSFRSSGVKNMVPASQFNPENGDLLFLRRPDNAANYYVFIKPVGSNYEFKQFLGGMSPRINTEAGSNAWLEYMVVKKQSNIPFGSGGYGLQIKKPDRSLAFDSRAFTSNYNFVIDDVWASGTLTTNMYGNAVGSGVRVSTAQNRWILANWATKRGTGSALQVGSFRSGNDGIYVYCGVYIAAGGMFGTINQPMPNGSDILIATGG